MSKVAERERATQNRVVKLFTEKMGYKYLGNLEDREDNSNIIEGELKEYLQCTGLYSEEIISRGILALKKQVQINTADDLYNVNKEVYSLLRYGTAKKTEAHKRPEAIQYIDWENPEKNHFAIAEEVTVKGARERRPDIVLYVNGIAIGVLELKKSSVSASEGIRQNISNQSHLFNKQFFTTVQLILAGNDSEGLYYGTTKTEEKYFLKWKEDHDNYDPDENLLDKHIIQLCNKSKLIDIIHNFVVFDFGIKKLCRPNQYFGVKEAQKSIKAKKGGIIWHTQGSGKSLTMVWLAKWVLENNPKARLLIVTDRVELDEQIEGVFAGVDEKIKRTKSGRELLTLLNEPAPRLICSLVHKFGHKEDEDTSQFINDITASGTFSPKGEFVVFIDECHRTQSGELHDAMKKIMPKESVFIGFTGTPLLKTDKRKSIEVFGPYIHTYKFDEAVKDKVILDLLYEARDVDQHVSDQKGIDDWFEIVTKDLSDVARNELKKHWGTMQKVLSTKSRLEKIVFDIKKDFLLKPRLKSGRGNAMLVARSIYEACRYYEIFQHYGFKKCAIITSFEPTAASIKLEDTGGGETERVEQFEIYQKMLASYGYGENDIDKFEAWAKEKFKKEPATMQLLIVVDKLLTGFDAVHCTYLYIDKEMRDHGLFQAICRPNRLGKESEEDPYYKDFGYIIDYKGLFESLNKSVTDYTSGAFDSFDAEDVKHIMTDRLKKAKDELNDALEALHKLCLDVPHPKGQEQFFHYFCGDPQNKDDLKEREEKRLTFYKLVVALIRAYNNIAPEITQAGLTEAEAEAIRQKVIYYTELRNAIKQYSGDYIDLKKYEPEMRQMLDMYLSADPSRVLSNLGEASLLQLIVENGLDKAIDNLAPSVKKNPESMSEAIENNMRKTIIQEMPFNPAYYERMSKILLDLVALRKQGAISYESLLKEYEKLAKDILPAGKKAYPEGIATKAQEALYDNLGENRELALTLHDKIMTYKDNDFRGNKVKEKRLRNLICQALEEYGITDDSDVQRIFELVSRQKEY